MITIVIPTICKTTLTRALQSLQAQTNPNWLCIVGGDGMDPVTDRPLGDFDLVIDERIQYFKGHHYRNQSLNRHQIIDRATTEWVGFLDDDDILMPEYIEHFYQMKNDVDIIIFKMNNYGNIIPSSNEIVHGSVGISFAAKKYLFDQIKFPEPPSEDYNWLALNVHNGTNIGYSEYIGYTVRP